MNRIQWLRFVPIAIIVGFALVGRPAHADDWSNFALVGCDAATNVVDVQEISVDGDQETYPAPSGYRSKWLGSLVKYISPPEGVPDDAVHGTYRKKIGDWKVSCTLKGNVYLIIVSPWSLNDMVMGQCGPGDPDLELTVYRDRKLLVKNLRFSYAGECMQDNNLAFFLRVKLSEVKRVVTIGDISSKIPEFDIPYSQMPKFDQRNSATLKYKPN
ncbi:hypothetical protein ABQJ54_03060 [Rhodanobacter sp. Si-c]|uniref:Uncharacterized protein n=1 Tax=Rhodanobacter lycopersici TaxID=3162487 RepID=A0ABV3QAE8_9GAMM